jgi:hypothetical protein
VFERRRINEFIGKVVILSTGLCDVGIVNVDCSCENERERERESDWCNVWWNWWVSEWLVACRAVLNWEFCVVFC